MADYDLSDDQFRLRNIFHPLAVEKFDRARKNDTQFVHYTSANAAMKILKTEQIWMRKISCMNDYMEVNQGLNCLHEACRREVGEQFKATLNGMFIHITSEIDELFRGWRPSFQNDTYIACFSEHSGEDNTHGRLSMWRAYSDTTGVALVLNNTPFLWPSGPPGVYSSPVSYLDDVSFEREFTRVVECVKCNKDFLRSQGRETVRDAVFNMFKFAALCTKHPGFNEEREWRVIYVPSMEQSPQLEKSIEVIGGTPQPIYKFQLKNMPNIGYTGIEIPEILEKIIVGPTKYPAAISEAFADLLVGAGVKDPKSRIHLTDIPLRL